MDQKKLGDKIKSEVLQFVAPGTPLRDGIDNVLRANTGGLIVLGYNDKVKQIVDGGFHVNCTFTPSFLYELAKMDGAIILNEQGTKILIANAQLAPDPMIPSSETGMRHRTAERVARQTKSLVIAISQRRNVISLYQGNFRYTIKDISVNLVKANQALQTLDKYRHVLNQSITNLGILEFEELVTYGDVLQVLRRVEMILRIKNELLNYLNELGTEGRLISLQMNELLADIEEEAALVFKDYAFDRKMDYELFFNKLQEMFQEEIIEDSFFLKQLGHSGYIHMDEFICPRGYRMLHKVPRLPIVIIENLINRFESFPHIISATVEELDDVEGIGEVRARKIKEGLQQIKEQLFADRQL
jgi:diadenylate cyclase